ncbi:MAG: hypothetical protein PUI49_07115 [Prevotellaceae bacterium]|nr:hypothetical protein [Prevotellaceae bacterium]MDY5210444.1 hypothetical protein [Prevotella sp.]
MKLINLTPHIINIVAEDGTRLRDIEMSGIIARVGQREEVIGNLDGIPVTRQVFGEVMNLPEPQEGVAFIVSRLVAVAATDRDDLFIPGPMVRNDQGQPCGCKGLSKV